MGLKINIVTKGKPWMVEEEKQLRQLFSEHLSITAIAKAMKKNTKVRETQDN